MQVAQSILSAGKTPKERCHFYYPMIKSMPREAKSCEEQDDTWKSFVR